MIDGVVTELIKTVQAFFHFGIPNGHLLGWDPDRLFHRFRKRFEGYHVANYTDFNYSYCNSFQIEPQYGNGDCYVLTAKFSFVAPVYSVHSTKYSDSKTRGFVVPETSDPTMRLLTGLVHQFATHEGFALLSPEMSNIVVDDVKLELSDIATLGKCLFDDYE
ncbi:MAG: hypothetical protein Q8M16_02545 [Pirellulaceae bacterium]|nr:hypothetical protein [Pirellulaceae bacterium]